MKIDYEEGLFDLLRIWWTSCPMMDVIETVLILMFPLICWISAYYIITRRRIPFQAWIVQAREGFDPQVEKLEKVTKQQDKKSKKQQ